MPLGRLLHDAFGSLRAPAPAPALPEPETLLRRYVIRGIAIVALVASVIYLTWRTTSTLDLGVWWASVPLLVLEVHATLGLALFAFSLWDVDRRPAHRDVLSTRDRIAVLVPTYNEGIEILLPTVAAAKAYGSVTRRGSSMTAPGRGGRLARSLGVRYLARASTPTRRPATSTTRSP